MEYVVNPWAGKQEFDIERLYTEFGIEPADKLKDILQEPPYFFRRGIVVGHRDYEPIAQAIRDNKEFHVMTGFMPSGHPHLGHLMVMKEVVWHVEKGGNGYITIADREAHAVRNISWEKCKEYGKEYLLCLYALGFTGKTYNQSTNAMLNALTFEASTKINFSELQAIYGFSQETQVAHAMSVITQVADILYPQVDLTPAPTLVPVGLDQDPHIRLTRGVAHKLRMFTVEDRKDHISIRSKNAPTNVMDELWKQFRGYKKYEGHIDIPGGDLKNVKEIVRRIELSAGGYGFVTPSATYHRFMPGLQGGKMSSSIPESTIGFFENEPSIKKKVLASLTGGKPTLEEQKREGGNPDSCCVYLLNLFHMISDDNELGELREQCESGTLTCGQCKKETYQRTIEFLLDFREKMDEVKHLPEEK